MAFSSAALLRQLKLLRSNTSGSFLMLTVGEATCDASLVSLSDDRHLELVESWDAVPWAELTPLHHLIGQALPPVVVVVPPGAVHSMRMPVVITPSKGEELVSPQQFQDELRKVQVAIWAEHRPRIAELLEVEPIDAVLVDFRVESVRVNGQEVLDPKKLEGEKVELDVLVRFTARDTFERVREVSQVPFFADPAWEIVAGHDAAGDALLVTERERTAIIKTKRNVKKRQELTRKTVPWGTQELIQAFEVRWGVSSRVGEEMLDQYFAGETSEEVKETVAVMLEKPRKDLESLMHSARIKAPVTTVSDLPLPTYKGQLKLQPIDTNALTDAVSLSSDDDIDPLTLAAFLEFYYSERYSEVNAWLRSRLNWFGAITSF